VQNNLDNITIALAGILQSIALVREISHTGKTNDAAFDASIYSIFQTDPKNVPSVFKNTTGVKLGLQKLIHTLETTHANDKLQSRYMLSLIHLQKKLSRSPTMLNTVSKRLQQTQKQVEYFSQDHPTVIANLADIYVNTISTFKFRIIIVGSQRILHVRENLDKVRALLLAGVRSAILWRQVGGSRLQLLFSRAKIKASAEKLLAEIEKNSID
jgi:high frequency lysogenization protein